MCDEDNELTVQHMRKSAMIIPWKISERFEKKSTKIALGAICRIPWHRLGCGGAGLGRVAHGIGRGGGSLAEQHDGGKTRAHDSRWRRGVRAAALL